MKTHLDWSAYDTYGAGDAYAGIPATGGNYAKAVTLCMNNHRCQRDGKGVMCPNTWPSATNVWACPGGPGCWPACRSGCIVIADPCPGRSGSVAVCPGWPGWSMRPLGIAARRPLPFPVPATTGERGEVLLFVDTFSHHFEPEVAEDAIAVLNRAGFRVRVAGPAAGDAEPARPLCCGRTYLSNGLVEQARHEARRTLDALGGRHSHRRPGAFVFIPDCPLAILVGVKASREGLERMSGRAGSNGYH